MQINLSNKFFATSSSKVMTFRPEEAQIFGLESAIVLNQIRYWIDPKRCKNNKEGQYWVYNSVKAWHEQFGMISERTLRRIFKRLEDLNVIITKKFNAWRRDQRKWYTINIEQLTSLVKDISTPNASKRLLRSIHDHTPPPDPESKSLVETVEASFDDNESISSKLNLEPDTDENGINIDVATMAECTFGQNDLMFIDTEITQQITLLSSKSKISDANIEREMINIWDQIIEKEANTTTLTNWRKKILNQVLKNQFQSSLLLWKDFCQLIAHNTFLMGGGPNQWKVSLDWALKAQNIQKVQERRYTGQREVTKLLPSSTFCENDIQGSPIWKTLATQLIKTIGVRRFELWFKGGYLANEASEYPILCLESDFKSSWVKQNFGDIVSDIVRKMMPQMKSLRFMN